MLVNKTKPKIPVLFIINHRKIALLNRDKTLEGNLNMVFYMVKFFLLVLL